MPNRSSAFVESSPSRSTNSIRKDSAKLGAIRSGDTYRYTHLMRREQGDRDRLRALVDGYDWALSGTSAAEAPAEQVPADAS